MSRQRQWHIGTSLAVSLVITVIAVWIDSARTRAQQTAVGLAWARQVTSQAEGMALKAREKGERDPIGWAVNYLAQGIEPRLVRISRVRLAEPASERTETHELDRSAGLFAYTRVLMPEEGAGVQVQLTLGYVGFLGTRSYLTSDLAEATCLLLFFVLAFFAFGRLFGFDDSRQLRALVTQWAGNAKAQLIRHGSHVREVVRQSQRLAVSSGRARDIVAELRAKIHSGLTELHQSRDFYKDGEAIASRAETLALNMAIEANRLGGDARRIADMATELHRRIQALHSVNRRSQALLQNIERALEPWATDADMAHHAFDGVRQATDLLGHHIRNTTQSLVDQAKLIQGLGQDLGARIPEAPREVAPAIKPESLPEPPDAAPARLPDPLPAIQEKRHKPLLRKMIQLGRIRAARRSRKSA